MNLLFCELLYPQSHARSNAFYINCLSELKCNLFVMSPPKLYGENIDNVTYINIEDFPIKKGKISYRVRALKYINMILRTVQKNKIDKIILASGDYIVLPFLCMRLGKNIELFLIHHAELDSLEASRIKKIIFGLYKNKIHHLVFEPYIKEFLGKGLGVRKELIWVMPHSLNLNYVNLRDNDQCIDLVGLSNSNSEVIINNFIQEELKNSFFKNRNIRVLLKSRFREFDDGYLRVTTKYLSDAEYELNVMRAKYIFIPFPQNFKYRESGTLMDALSNKKYVIGSDIKLMKYYKSIYPGICFVFKNFYDILQILVNNHDEKESICHRNFEKFVSYHSANNYKKIMSSILKIKE